MEVQNNKQLSNYTSDYNHKTKAEKGRSNVKKNLNPQYTDADIKNNNGTVTTELAYNEGKRKQNLQDDEISYVKNPYAAKTEGYSYHVKLAMWFLLCGKEKIEKKEIIRFFLAADIKEAPTFGHIVFKYHKEGCKSGAIFLQAKYKENETYESNDEKLATSSKDFDLLNAWNAYSQIINCFSSKKVENRIFGEELSDVECSFVFFTNASPNIDYRNIKKMTVDPDDILYFSKANNFYYSFTPCEETEKTILDCNGSQRNPEFTEFLCKLKLLYEQPNEEELDEIIKQKIHSMFFVEKEFVGIVFASAKNKMQEWLGKKGKSNFLTTENRFFEDAARVSIKFDIEEPVGLFIGRDKELEDLHKILENPGEEFISQIASITGIAGVGKTELARKYISEFSKEYDENIIWINAENDTNTTQSFIRVAEDSLGINTFDKNGMRKETQIIVKEIYDNFARIHRKSLFVFDNYGRYKALGDTGEGIDKFLPFGPEKSYVLIISLDQEWENIKTIPLDLFTNEEAAEFIRKALNDIVNVEESEVNNLAAELQYLPLTLTQAVAYIKMENLELSGSDKSTFTVSNYLELFEANTRDILSSGGSNEIFDRYPETVMTTWQITMGKVKQITIPGEVALDILNIMSYLAPDKIPVDDIFSTLINDGELRHSALELLDKYCMVSLRSGKVNAHRVVQQATRIELEEQGKTHEMVQKTFTMLKQSFPYGKKDLNDISKKKLLLPHLEVFLYHIHRLITEKLMDASKEERNIYLDLITLVVDGYFDLGNAQRQKELLEVALSSFEGHYRPNNFKAPKTLANLSGAYNASHCNYKEKQRLERALKIFKDLYGPNHYKVAIMLERIGNVYGALGDHQKKKELLKQALKILIGYYGPDRVIVAMTLRNLGNVYGALGDHHKQKRLLKRALKIEEDHYEPNHLEVARALFDLGICHGALGDHHKEKEELERALKVFEDHYGPNHIKVATALGSLSNTHSALGDHHKEKELLERALKIFEDHYGSNHIKVAIALGSLSNAYGALGDHHIEKELLEEALPIFEDHFGPNHTHVAELLESLSNAYGALGDHNKQKELLEKALEIFEDYFGTNHTQVAEVLLSLSKAYGYLGDPKTQKELLERALKINEYHYTPNHFQVAEVLQSLGNAHGDLGEPLKQVELLERALKIYKDHYGRNHFKVARTFLYLVSAFDALGDKKKREELLKKVLHVLERRNRRDYLFLGRVPRFFKHFTACFAAHE